MDSTAKHSDFLPPFARRFASSSGAGIRQFRDPPDTDTGQLDR